MKTILLIDDETDILQLLQRILEKSGYNVLTAENGKMADRLLDQHTFDLVITDIIMPDKDGMEVIFQLKQTSPSIKIIAISGGGKLAPEGYLKMAEIAGADAIIQKPFESSYLLQVVNNLLSP